MELSEKFGSEEELESYIDDIYLNNMGEGKEIFEGLCPFIDIKILEHLKVAFSKELGFDKKTTHDEYLYRTGVVEVLKYIQEQINLNSSKK